MSQGDDLTTVSPAKRGNWRKYLAATGALVAILVLLHLAIGALAPARLAFFGLVLFPAILVWSFYCAAASGFLRPVVGLAVMGLGAALGFAVPQAAIVAAVLVGGGFVLLVLSLLASPVLSYAKRPLPQGILPAAFLMIGAGAAALLAGGLRQSARPAIPDQNLPVAAQLAAMHDTDQQDRFSGLMLLDGTRDAARLARVKELDAARLITLPADQFNAALVYQHARCPDEFQRAAELANAAAAAGVPNAEALAHAATDRWLLSIGQPQRYGTQLTVSKPADCKGL